MNSVLQWDNLGSSTSLTKVFWLAAEYGQNSKRSPLEAVRNLFLSKSRKDSDFEHHLRQCYRELFHAAYNFTRDPTEAEDLLQEAVIRGYKAWANFEQGTNFKAWMWRILTNLYITNYRRKQKRGDDISLDAIDGDLWLGPETLFASPEQTLLLQTLDSDLQVALESLPDAIRVVLLMTEVEQMSYQEVADILQIPIGTVRSRLFRGRLLMRERLDGVAQAKGWEANGNA